MGGGWGGVPIDAFTATLLLIPQEPRRRLRLVCQYWRDVIDERAPPESPPIGAKGFSSLPGDGAGGPSRAYVLDEPTAGGSGRELDLLPHGAGADVRMDAVDSPRAWCYCNDEPAYTFGYHPATGQYKIVHVPCHEPGGLDAVVLVFTLGDGDWQWREVAAPAGSSCCRRFGVVTVDGVSYWVGHEGLRADSVFRPHGSWTSASPSSSRRQEMAWPHIVHGEHVLTTCHLRIGGLRHLSLNARAARVTGGR
ncbi:unnamed protein product [Urochloa humidicola]